MSELAIRDASAVAVPAPQLPVPPMNDIDSWTQIVVQVVRLAEEICDTPFVPDGLRGSAPAVSAAILSGREMGLGPMTSLANIDVIKGKPTQKPLLMRAMIQSRGHKWVDVDVSDIRVIVKGCRKGESEWTEVTFTAAQAKQGGIDLGKYPADKLYARASSRLAKRKFADVIMGMAYSSDEAEDDDGPDVDMTTGEVTAGTAVPAIAAPPARTAQRKQRTPQTSSPATAGSAAPQAPTEVAGGGLPPLPGEEEPDPTTPGASSSARAPGSGSQRPSGAPSPSSPAGSATNPSDAAGSVSTPQLTAIWTVLSQVYHFGPDEKDVARDVCAQILKIELKSSTDLSKNQASTVINTLAMWQGQAKTQNEEPRGYLMLMLQAAAEARGEASGE